MGKLFSKSKNELTSTAREYKDRKRERLTDELFPFDIFHFNNNLDGQSTNELNGAFIYSQLLIDSLVRLKSNSVVIDDLNTCKQHKLLKENDFNSLKDLLQQYSHANALNLYTKEGCLYKLLNKALRDKEIKLLFAFRFLIRDIGEQLAETRWEESSPSKVYRGQRMSSNEFNRLQHSTDQLISNNVFFSTSLNREMACMYAGGSEKPDISEKCEKVLFVIEIDSQLKNIKPFANIRLHSHFPDEDEVLFMPGSIFRIISIYQGSDGIQNIKMKLCSNNDKELKALMKYMMDQYDSKEANLLIFGNILRKMNKLDDAEYYYKLFLKEAPDDCSSISACYHSLGITARMKNDYDASLVWYTKSHEIDKQLFSTSDHCNFAESYNSFGVLYTLKRDYNQALKYLNDALAIFLRVLGKNCLEVARCYNNISNVYQVMGDYSKALNFHEISLSIRQNCLPANDFHLGQSYNNIGNIQLLLKNFNSAIQYYKDALQIYNHSCTNYHIDVAITYENMGRAFRYKNDQQSALAYFGKAHEIYKHLYPDKPQDAIRINEYISHINSNKK